VSTQWGDRPVKPTLVVLGILGVGDPTGTNTLARYRYQTKITVGAWLTCLLSDGPTAVVCERVEDQVVVYGDRLHFQQVKTRDRGVWTPGKICEGGGGLDSLVRAYKLVRAKGYLEMAWFELLLEGPATEQSDGAAFFENPSRASTKVRDRLRAHGLPAECVDDFLSRLRLHPSRPSRDTIDSVNLCAMACLAPDQPMTVVLAAYEELLKVAEAAQSAELALARAQWQEVIATLLPARDSLPALGRQLLTREQLLSLLPLISDAVLLDRQVELRRLTEGGASMSPLERKLLTAGATPDTLTRAKEMRALANVRLQQLLASSDGNSARLERLASNALTFAQAVTTTVQLEAGRNPMIAARPAEATFASLAQQVAELQALDGDQLFADDPYGVLGYLCHLSDQCRFGWRAAS
jgi:hypothetical protein